MARVKIRYDESQCQGVQSCKKCLEVCPQSVFAMIPINNEKFKIADESGGYELWIVYETSCIACNLCVDACPPKALSIEIS
ncbi:MAG: 4Fe-4S binding protein [Candidatus Helarchaeota archaeon]|nr:4Fe-4S binding protein [Candidatus Helarchaeota archaeon]